MKYLKQTRFGQTYMVLAIGENGVIEVDDQRISLDVNTDSEAEEYSWYMLNYDHLTDCNKWEFQTFYTKTQIAIGEMIVDFQEDPADEEENICKAGYCCNETDGKDFCSESCAKNWINE